MPRVMKRMLTKTIAENRALRKLKNLKLNSKTIKDEISNPESNKNCMNMTIEPKSSEYCYEFISVGNIKKELEEYPDCMPNVDEEHLMTSSVLDVNVKNELRDQDCTSNDQLSKILDTNGIKQFRHVKMENNKNHWTLTKEETCLDNEDRTEAKISAFPCLYCHKTMPSLSEATHHTVAEHYSKNYFKCGVCPVVLSTPTCRDTHMRRHKMAKCNLCEFEGNGQVLRKHKNMAHKNVKVQKLSYKCKYCEQCSFSRQTINEHQKDEHGEASYSMSEVIFRLIRSKDKSLWNRINRIKYK